MAGDDGERYCPTCGRANELIVRYCGNCGQPLAGGTVLLQRSAGAFSEEDTVAGGIGRSRHYRAAATEEEMETVRPPIATASVRRETFWASAGARAQTTEPVTAAFLSFFFPGVGQMLCRQVGKGIVLALLAWVAVRHMRLAPFELVMLAGRLLVAIDAYNLARRQRAGRKTGDWDWYLQDVRR